MHREICIFILSQWTEGVVSRQSVAFGRARTCQLHLIKRPDKGERCQPGLRKSFIQRANGPEYKSFFENLYFILVCFFFVASTAKGIVLFHIIKYSYSRNCSWICAAG